ncbi:MAG: ATP-dependent helicase, partial [Actinobacteria bacterium]|nr:ATP-dependent helicase [Actinomycetota bacterium]
ILVFPSQFPRADGSESMRLPLEVNFRSGARILALANHMIEGIHPSRRPEKILRAFPPLGEGELAVGLYADEVAEAAAVADEAIRRHDAGTPWGEMAILCRKKRLFSSYVESFRARGIPLEVIGLGGLLTMPEVCDLVALLRVLDDPMANVALARLLMGPRWRIGYRDLALIGRHAALRNRELKEQMEVETPGDVAFSLAEEIAKLDEVEGVSDEARARIAAFNAELARVRAATHLPLPELAARALDMLGIARELDASPSPAARAAKRNLANFMDRIAAFEPLEGEQTLNALVRWLDAVEEADQEIEASQPTEADSVKLMTIHQAKGLEYDLVFVPGLARGDRSQIFPDTSRRANPAASPKNVPVELRGDRDVFPRFTGNLSAFNDDLKKRALEEELRLLYVALTRARRRLVCTAAHWYYPSGMDEALTKPLGPSEFLRAIKDFEDVEVLSYVEDAPEPNPLIERRAQRVRSWPQPAKRPASERFPDGIAAAVRRARAQTQPDGTLFPVEPSSDGPVLPKQLPVSAVVTYATCPKRFFWSYVRPLPRRSSAAARTGTIVHAWIEQVGKGQTTLYDPEEFEDRPAADASRLGELREAFRRSRFASLPPVHAERSFALVVGDHIVSGRIDAIFERPGGGWEIVDWKSGRARDGGGAEEWQLDLYALAAQEIWGKSPDDVTVTFVYLGEPDPARAEHSYKSPPAAELRARLESMLADVAAGRFEPAPAEACAHCDFRKDCREGTAYLNQAAEPG